MKLEFAKLQTFVVKVDQGLTDRYHLFILSLNVTVNEGPIQYK